MNDIITGRIEVASNRTQQYLKDSDLNECRITILHYETATDTVCVSVTFDGNVSSQNLMDITKIWFWDLRTPPNNLTHYSPETNELRIILRYCTVSSNVYTKLIELGTTVHSFSVDFQSFTFEVSPKDRVDLLSDALDEIRNIVNPARNNGFSVYQVVNSSSTSLRIHPDKN